MTIAFSMTARELITRAMRDRKILAIGRAPTAAELSYGVETLNLLLKDLASKGVTPWRDIDGTATFGIGVASVEMDPRPVDVLDAHYVQSATYQRPLTRWEQGEYSTLPNLAQSGVPLIYSMRYTPTAVTMRVWPVPTVSTTIGYSYSRVIEDVSDAADTLDIPQTWLRGIGKMLASQLDAFGGEPGHIAKIMAEAEIIERKLLDHDRPDSYTLEPE